MNTPAESNVPRRAILLALQKQVEELYWLYGTSCQEAQSRQERWDVRSILDYVVMLELGASALKTPYIGFYIARNTVMDMLIEALSCESAMGENLNYGDWRMCETNKNRSTMDVVRVIQRARKVLAESKV